MRLIFRDCSLMISAMSNIKPKRSLTTRYPRFVEAQELVRKWLLELSYDWLPWSWSSSLAPGMYANCRVVEVHEASAVVSIALSLDNWAVRSSTIRLVATPCNYWGKRWWYEDPVAGGRCQYLFVLNDGSLASRRALNLAYPDQQENKKFLAYRNAITWRYMNAALSIARSCKYEYRNWRLTRKGRAIRRNLAKVATGSQLSAIAAWLERTVSA